MIKIENTVTPSPEQWNAIIMGMRNPMNSWERSDSFCNPMMDNCRDCSDREKCAYIFEQDGKPYRSDIGPNDHDLMMRLTNGGPVHAKYRRMIPVYVTVTAPLYWWKEFDTYRVGVIPNPIDIEMNSCSTMHKIAAKEFTLEDFSFEHLLNDHSSGFQYPIMKLQNNEYVEEEEFLTPLGLLGKTVEVLNVMRHRYLETKDKRYWWQMIQLLPSSYNQKRTVELNYEVLNNIYHFRKDHKLDEWREFCKWIESLPYSEIINPEKEDLRILIEPKKIPVDEFKKLIGIVNKAYGKNCEEQENLEHLIDISRPGSDHPHYVIGLGASEDDLTDYEKDLLKKSDEYWKDKE